MSERDFKKKLFNYIITQVQKPERRTILNQFRSIKVEDGGVTAPKSKDDASKITKLPHINVVDSL